MRERTYRLTALVAAAVGVFALGLFGPVTARGQESEPVAVVSVQSLNALLGDPADDEDVGAVGHLIGLAGYEEYAAMGKGITLGFTRGIKRDQPWGVLVKMEGEEFQTVVFVPTDDIKLLLKTLRGQIGEFDVRDDGLIQIELPFLFQPAYIKQVGGWAYASTDLELLADVPADPRPLLAGLESEYAVGAQLYPGNIPEETRKSWIDLMRAGMMSAMADADDAEKAAAQLQAAEMQIQTVETLLTETETLSLGLQVDPMSSETVLEIVGVGVQGSDMAKQAELLAGASTRFAHFHRKDAAATFVFASPMTKDSIEQWTMLLDSAQESAAKEIDNDDDVKETEKAEAKTAVRELFVALKESVADGKLDMAGYVSTDDQKLQTVFAAQVADGKKLEASVKKIVELGKSSADDVIVELDLETFQGITFHHIAMPIKDDPEEDGDDESVESARKVFGPNVDLYIGFAGDAVYGAVGPGSLDRLKATIKQGAGKETKLDVPQSIRISAKDFAEFFVPIAVKEKDKRDEALKIVKEMGPESAFTVEITPSERGTTTRLSVGDDVIRMIGAMSRLGQSEDDFDF